MRCLEEQSGAIAQGFESTWRYTRGLAVAQRTTVSGSIV